MVGVLIIGSLSTAMNIANVASWDQDIVIGAVLLVVVLGGSLGQGVRRPGLRLPRPATARGTPTGDTAGTA
jgi:ribose/xylose/arabinose/galactoside ABC-type transport system permease subunit